MFLVTEDGVLVNIDHIVRVWEDLKDVVAEVVTGRDLLLARCDSTEDALEWIAQLAARTDGPQSPQPVVGRPALRFGKPVVKTL